MTAKKSRTDLFATSVGFNMVSWRWQSPTLRMLGSSPGRLAPKLSCLSLIVAGADMSQMVRSIFLM